MHQPDFTAQQRAMIEMWERHTAAEFATKSVDATMATMTVGTDRIVDELMYKFTHTIDMPWMLPGVAPTGKHVEVALVVVVELQAGRISNERIYWDQASVLAQVGLIDKQRLPVTGIEASRKVVDPTGEPSNALIERAARPSLT
ncbi:MAG: ester cyclase [Gemmatimonadales bacterium]|nr:ester cyclase [Gemmatimonadales bacterium]